MFSLILHRCRDSKSPLKASILPDLMGQTALHVVARSSTVPIIVTVSSCNSSKYNFAHTTKTIEIYIVT